MKKRHPTIETTATDLLATKRLRKRATMEDLLLQFEELHLPTVSKGTQKRYQVDIKYRIRPFFGRCALSLVDQMAVDAFRSQIIRVLSPKSVNDCLVLLKFLLGKAVEWGLLDRIPAVVRGLRLPEAKYRWWERREFISAFLSHAKKTKLYAAYLLALECGMRRGEIIGLDRDGVDLERCQIHVYQQWLDKERRLGPTKGRKNRFLTFDPRSDLKSALKEIMAQSRSSGALFTSRTGRRIHPNILSAKLFSKLVFRAKVPRIRFHDLRHTFASWYMLEHDNIWSLMRILGHSDIQTTQRYAHLSGRHHRAGTMNWSGRDP